MGTLKAVLSVLTVLLLITPVTGFGAVSPLAQPPKSFAVFVASYDPQTGRAQGGVAGTAFFISPKKAVTAFHVLQPKSFQPAAGFQKVQVWLVHENEPAIELRAGDIAVHPGQDMTLIHLDEKRMVKNAWVYPVGTPSGAVDNSVETEGFRANTVGPILSLEKGRLQITSVPALERLQAKGEIREKLQVDLNANDVRLNHVPCLHVTYVPVVGLSGGPVLEGGRVVGMNSFADPSTRQTTWAVDLKSFL